MLAWELCRSKRLRGIGKPSEMENPVSRQNIIEIVVVGLIFVVVNLFSAATQKPLTYNNGIGWDGTGYYATAKQFAQGQIPHDEAPFVYRIGTPLLAALADKNDLLLGFQIVNLVANILAVILLLIWLRLYISSWKIRTLLMFLFITQWHAPIRYNYFLPASVEPWLLVAVLAGLIAIHHAAAKLTGKAVLYVSLVVLFGVAFKEAAILIPFAMLLSRNPIEFRGGAISISVTNLRKNIPFVLFVPLLVGMVTLAGIHTLITQSNSFSFPVEAVKWAYDKPLLTFIHAWLVAFGPILVILIFGWKTAWAFLQEHQSQLAFVMGVSFLAWIGGNDTERYLYMAMPVIFVLLGRVMESSLPVLASVRFMVVLGIGQLISQRILWTTPDYPSPFAHTMVLFTPLGSNVPYLDLWSYAWLSVKATALAEYLAFGLVLLIWLNYRSAKQLGIPSS